MKDHHCTSHVLDLLVQETIDFVSLQRELRKARLGGAPMARQEFENAILSLTVF